MDVDRPTSFVSAIAHKLPSNKQVPDTSSNEEGKKLPPKQLHNLSLNTHKAGMAGLDAEKINDIIQKASQGSRFYVHKQQAQHKLDEKIKEMVNTAQMFSPKQVEEATNQMASAARVCSSERDLSHTIVHVDMDMFYAAVEMRDHPALRDVPMAVGSTSMLSTSNYVARKFGVRAAMPGFIALKLCPNLVIVPTNFDKYKAVSRVVGEVFALYDPNYVMMSLDEAYLDLTPFLAANANAYDDVIMEGGGATLAEVVVKEMRKKIEEATQLTASAGIAANTRLAKVCSDLNKPDGQYYLPPQEDSISAFMETLPIRKISGIGNVMEQHLRALGIAVCGEIREQYGLLQLLFSHSTAAHFMHVSLGLGETDLTDMGSGDRKSISNETTFSGTKDKEQLLGIIYELCKELQRDMVNKNLLGKVFTLKMKTIEFVLKTRSQCLGEPTQDLEVMIKTSKRLLQNEIDKCSSNKPLALRLLGVRMSTLSDTSEADSKQITISKMMAKLSATKQSEGINNSENVKSEMITNISEDLSETNSEEQLAKNEDMYKDENPPSINNFNRNKFICPICNQVIPTKFLKAFNKHIDQCLLTFSGSDCNDNLLENELNIQLDKDSLSSISTVTENNALAHSTLTNVSPKATRSNITTLSMKNVFTDQTLARNGTVYQKNDPDPKILFNDTSSNELVNPADNRVEDNISCARLSCPVCCTARFTCHIKLNKHLDECLSLREVENVTKGASQPSNVDQLSPSNNNKSICLKRKTGPSNKSCNKKSKHVNSILNYFN